MNEKPERNDQQEAEDPERQPDVVYRRWPDRITTHQIDGQHVIFQSDNDIELKLTLHTPEIIQLTYFVEGDLRSDFSYAIDPDFDPPDVDFKLNETQTYFQLITSVLRCRVMKKNMQVEFWDHHDNKICEDHGGFSHRSSIMEGTREVKITKTAPEEMSFMGLGDKAHPSNLRGKVFENWTTDAYEYERGSDPLYRSIPFYTALHEERAHGIFLDNTYRTHFDFDAKENNVSSFSAEGGIMNYYFIYGPQLTSVSERYTLLTGTPEIPPLWALGYHQSRWSYFPDEKVRKIADRFREEEIPCDAIYLDIDYMDDFRCFTWNDELFPDPAKMIEYLQKNGFKTVVMIDPGIKVDHDYVIYQQGKQHGYFCTRPNGDQAIAPVWPGPSSYPDFTHPKVRSWWSELYEDLLAQKGVSGIWNDMNEPAVFEVNTRTLPEHIRHHYDGQPASHKKAHNIYGMQMAKASYQGLKKHRENKRPFLLTRANFSGGQRYSSLWTGDNIASWDHLKLANEQSRRLSISGYSFTGTDIGGFIDKPSPELFTRWLQLGIFHPLFRTHSMGYHEHGASAIKKKEKAKNKQTTPQPTDLQQEPWAFDARHTDINRDIIKLRYRLLHYLYSAFYQYITQGTPVLRPLSYYDQNDPVAVKNNREFIFGDKILVSPVLDKGKKKVETYFPKGTWYDFRTNKKYHGKTKENVEAPLEDIPFFIKAGTVLPLREVMQFTGEGAEDVLELNVYYGDEKNTSHLYEDAGEGYDYRDGVYRLTEFEVKSTASSLSLRANREGSYEPDYKQTLIHFMGLPFEPASAAKNDEAIEISEQPKRNRVYTISIENDFEKISISG